MGIEGALVQEAPLPPRRSPVRKDIGTSESLADPEPVAGPRGFIDPLLRAEAQQEFREARTVDDLPVVHAQSEELLPQARVCHGFNRVGHPEDRA